MATTAGDVTDAVLRLMDEDLTSPSFVTRAEVLTAIRFALVELQIAAAVVASGTISSWKLDQ